MNFIAFFGSWKNKGRKKGLVDASDHSLNIYYEDFTFKPKNKHLKLEVCALPVGVLNYDEITTIAGAVCIRLGFSTVSLATHLPISGLTV